MALRTTHRRMVDRPDGYGKNTGSCGDTVVIFLVANGGRIQAVYYDIDGCINTNACANVVAEMATGRSIAAAWQIRTSDVIDDLQTLDTDHYHCAELAVGALYRALADLRQKTQRPWMKLYQV
jgi:nitrogen fixation NifU-like protein